MTLDEAKELAKLVLTNKPKSHVEAARVLSEFVLGLRSVTIELPRDPTGPRGPVDREARTVPAPESDAKLNLEG